MDQVKVYLGVAKKHHFWILAVIVIVTAVVVWSKASGSLHTLYQTNKQQIESAESSLQKAGSEEKVNDAFTQKVDGLHDGLKQRVFKAWQQLYERQVALFKWPVKETDAGKIDLNTYKPDEEIPQYLRSFYNESVVKEEWEDLLSKVDLRRPREAEVRTAEESGEEDEEAVTKRGTEYEGLVVWSEPLRKAIVDRYYTPNATPSTTRLRLMQEDAWLFDSLVQIVNAVNFGATDPLRAPIKQIDVLDVAQWAIDASVRSGGGITIPGSSNSTATGGMGNMMANMPAPGGMSASGGSQPGGSGGGAASTGGAATASGDNDNAWKEGRYLDEKGQPLKGDAHPFAEFRQMFVYMKFIMDQRRIPDLVAASANAPLPIETRQIRVQTLKEGDTIGSSGLFPSMGGGMMGGGMMGGGMMGGGMMGGGMMGGGMMGGGMMGGSMPGGMMGGGSMPGGMDKSYGMTPSQGGMMGGMMGGSMPGGMMGGSMPGGMMGGGMGSEGTPQGFGQGAQEGAVETTVYDAIVELSGVIYLYNPPDITKLGTGGAGSPEKRSFGVPKTAVPVPGTALGGGTMSAAPTMTPPAK